MVFFSLEDKMLIHLAYKAQTALLIAKKMTILIKYLDFIDFFSRKSATKLLKYFDINKRVIDLKTDKQLSYRLIYIFEPVEIKNPKIYIKINKTNKFIQIFKSNAEIPILFV